MSIFVIDFRVNSLFVEMKTLQSNQKISTYLLVIRGKKAEIVPPHLKI